MLTHFSLFTGIGGIDLAAEWAGFQTVGQCEYADYPTKVLEKHWPNVPRWRDIRDVTADSFYKRTGLRTVNLVSGGDPCQPHSVSGERKGMEDERFLWPEMFRIVQEIYPDWVINENVAGSISNGVVLKKINDLESIGFECQAFVVPAYSVGAYHRRDRVFIIANTESERWERILCSDVDRQHEKERHSRQITLDAQGNPFLQFEKRVGRPGILGVDNGIPSRVDRLKCAGNAVMPQQIYPILQAIADIENSIK